MRLIALVITHHIVPLALGPTHQRYLPFILRVSPCLRNLANFNESWTRHGF